MKINKMPQDNMSWVTIFVIWIKDNFYLLFAVPLAFLISYLSELKEEAATGNHKKGKVFNALICAMLTLPYYLAVDETFNYFSIQHSQSIATIIGAFLGSLGADRAKDFLLRALESIFSIFGKKS